MPYIPIMKHIHHAGYRLLVDERRHTPTLAITSERFGKPVSTALAYTILSLRVGLIHPGSMKRFIMHLVR